MYKDLIKTVNSFVNLTKKATVFSKVNELPNSLRNALKSVNYTKEDIALEATETVSPFDAGGKGRKAFFMLVNLETGEHKVMHGSWGGAGVGSHDNLVDLDTTNQYPLKPGTAAIKGSEGDKGTYATIYLNPDNITKLLTTIDESLTQRDRWILYTFDGLTSAGRRDEWQYNNDIPTEDDLNRLANLGYLKRSKNGATKITTEGKNVLNRKPGMSIKHPKNTW